MHGYKLYFELDISRANYLLFNNHDTGQQQ